MFTDKCKSILGGSLVTQKSESHITAVYTAFYDCGYFQNPSDDTSPILSSTKISRAPNWSKYLEPFALSPPLLMVTMHKNWKLALVMIWSMHISNVAAQFRLASEELMQNDTIYNQLLREQTVLHAPSDSSIPSLSFFYPFHLSPNYFHSIH